MLLKAALSSALTSTSSPATEPPPRTIPASEWSYSDKPQQHELWEQQVALERQMLKAGADAFRDRVIEAKRKGQFTRLHPVRNLLVDWLPGVSDGVTNWVRAVDNRRGGPTPIALPYVREADPETAAAIAIREMLDSLSINRPKLVGIAMRIGRTLEHEQRIRHWEATEPKLFYHYKDEMDRNKSTATHRRRVNINRFNHLLEHRDEEALTLEWTPWPEEVIFRVGIALIDCVVRTTGWFEVMPDFEHRARFKGRPNKPQYIVVPKEGMVQWLAKYMEDAELASPEFKPTIMPPRRWKGSRGGGYWTPYVKAPRLVRFKASQESQKEHAADEYDAFSMDAVYTALHAIQETPYRINGRVLDVVLEAWQKDTGIGKLPQVSEMELPPRTPRMEEHAEASREARAEGRTPSEPDEATKEDIADWKRRATPVHRFNAKRASRLRSASATVRIAMEYRDYEAIYFPHMLDFRGRIYPIPNFLQPQGDDLARGLLLFSEEVPITEGSGADGWLAVHLASCWGNDKVSFEDRIQWVEEREDLWRSIAADPFANMEWAEEADKPWQSLAAIFEWVGFLEQGYGYMSNLPVMVDGTCNGIQHLAAMTRDEVTGKYVNLVPGDKPEDIYKFVAEDLQETLDNVLRGGGIEATKALYWLELTGYNLPRSLTKRQVMVLPYGATKDAFYKYTREWLDAQDPMQGDLFYSDEESKAAWEQRTARISFLVTHMWDSVKRTVRGGLEVMEWLQQCAKVAALDNQPIYWVTPSGFVVRHFYGLNRMKRVDILLDGERYQISRAERTAKLSVKDQLQGIAPNFIHSLDAAALVGCVNKCHAKGIRSLATIHDAYGTHAANMWPLSHAIREAFVEVHRVDNLGNFRASCQRVLVDHLVAERNMDPFDAAQMADEMLPKPLELGDLDLEAVLQSDYFFA